MGAASPPAPRRLLGFRPRELRPEARSAMRAQPNSAALKNASVFGAPELRPRAGVSRKAAGRRGFIILNIRSRGPRAVARRTAEKY